MLLHESDSKNPWFMNAPRNKFLFGKAITQIKFFVGTATQLVIPPPHIPWIGQGGGILLLSYSLICFVASPFFVLNGRGENRSPSPQLNSCPFVVMVLLSQMKLWTLEELNTFGVRLRVESLTSNFCWVNTFSTSGQQLLLLWKWNVVNVEATDMTTRPKLIKTK